MASEMIGQQEGHQRGHRAVAEAENQGIHKQHRDGGRLEEKKHADGHE